MPRLAAVSLSGLQHFQEEGGLSALLAELKGSLFTTHGGSDLIIHGRPDPVPLLDFIVEVGDCRQAVRRGTHLAWVLVCCSVLLAPYSTVRSECYLRNLVTISSARLWCKRPSGLILEVPHGNTTMK